MTDKDKIKEEIERIEQILDDFNKTHNNIIDCADYNNLMDMAQWKDEQFDEEKKYLLGLVNMLSVDEHNQTIIEDLKALLQ